MSNDHIPEAKSQARVFLETFGCQMNILDSELVEGQFRDAGYQFVDKVDDANVVLLNTCSVRDLSEQKVLSRLGILRDRKEKGEELVVGVLGCMAERSNDELVRKRPFIDVLVGPSKINDTLRLVESALSTKKLKTQKSLSYFVKRKGQGDALLSPFDDLEALDASRTLIARKNPWQAYVRITRGCNKFCSFCVVPRTRGPEVHRPPLSIIDEVKRLNEAGAIEITLLGQTINHYYYAENDKRWSFADLLFNIHEQVPGVKRLRFLTSYPRDFTDEALDVMASCSRICRYLHIPLQSGSDKILRAMNRGYDVETYLNLIDRAKKRMPNINILGDMIVGFPDETDEDFQASLNLLETVRFKNLFIFKYSPRPNTVAERRYVDNVPADMKKWRNNEMLAVQNRIAYEHHQAMIGHEFAILCEGESKLDRRGENGDLVQLRSTKSQEMNLIGRTEGDHIVHFSGDKALIGTIVSVRVNEARPLSLDGTLV